MSTKKTTPRRKFDLDFKRQAVQMLLDGFTASSVADHLGIDDPNLLYRWKTQLQAEGHTSVPNLEARIQQLEEELRRTQRERDVLKKALAIFSREPKTSTS